MKRNEFLTGKYCKLVFNTGFVLSGLVVEAEDDGIIFSTDQKTSYIRWDSIRELVVEE